MATRGEEQRAARQGEGKSGSEERRGTGRGARGSEERGNTSSLSLERKHTRGDSRGATERERCLVSASAGPVRARVSIRVLSLSSNHGSAFGHRHPSTGGPDPCNDVGGGKQPGNARSGRRRLRAGCTEVPQRRWKVHMLILSRKR